jgi:hypothetical protein
MLRMRTHLVALFVLAMTATAAFGQVIVQVVPPNPTTASSVSFSVTAAIPCDPVTATRTGNVFRIDVTTPCVVVLPVVTTEVVPVGFLPEGLYTYNVFVDNVFESTGTFLVAAAAPSVPTLSPAALTVLALAFAFAGIVLIRRV